ncbi:MAG: excinuclease ABC subunit C [Erysipelotrichaceae bacterium]|nr:excinuclease ABC subunit C [Erysipelotrichaceae bacterium]
MTDKLRALIDNLKHKPGVYLMYDKDNTIIYVGKAKDLQKRVSQYFLRPHEGKVQAMVSHVDHFETIQMNNEKEAFLLEMNLIHEHLPRYNILLKDDSHYPYIALKKKGDPTLMIKRNNKDKAYTYFGPFPNSGAAFSMIDLLNKIFPIRKCKNIPMTSCLYYHLGQCLAPCINKIDEETYDNLRSEISNFLSGDNSKQYNEIKVKMMKASEEMNYELAKEYHDILKAIEHINTSQTVESKDKTNRDIFGYSSREGYIALAMILFRNGLLLGKEVWVVESFGNNEEQVGELISQYYSTHPLPTEIIVNSNIITDNLRDILDTNVVSVTRGKLNDLILTCIDNANNALDQYFLSARVDTDKLALLEELGRIINIPTPYHIELFDNSHIQGSSPVGAMVAFINGEPAKKLYRKFNIEHEESRDDIASMKEVTFRHYKRLKEENKKLPDLILVDGGLIQIEAAKDSLDKLGLNINLYGLYKNDRHQTSGLMDVSGNTYPIENKNLFFLLTRMQDEIHRFAITFHREKRNKKMTASILDDIKGLGSRRAQMIRKAYPDIVELKNASINELAQIIPLEVAEALYNKLHQ